MCMNMNMPYASTFGIFKNYHALYVLLMFIELANYMIEIHHTLYKPFSLLHVPMHYNTVYV